MRSRNEQQDGQMPSDRELKLLSEVDRNPQITQRDLSRRVGIALGLTNLLLQTMVAKGYVKMTRAGWKRWLYNLTPAGFSRRVQLTMVFIHRFLDHYQQVRQTLREELGMMGLHEESRIAIYGTGEFAELVYLALRENDIEELDVFATPGTSPTKFLGIRVQDVETLRPELYDRVIVANLNGAGSISRELEDLGIAPEKLVTFFAGHESGETK